MARVIIALVRSLGVDKPEILDFGCGTGWLSERLAEFGRVSGVDLAADVIAAAQSRAPHIRFLQWRSLSGAAAKCILRYSYFPRGDCAHPESKGLS